jgi:hypothetical protein
MTSSLERTARKTMVASIVALHGNGCKQASYSVHVTLLLLQSPHGARASTAISQMRPNI